jgi:hypothetical protein
VVLTGRWTWLGIGYGFLVLFFAFVSAGFGHGTYLPWSIYAAPASLIPIAGMFIAPLFWGGVGFLIDSHRRTAAIVMMSLHTITLGIVLRMGSPMEPANDQWVQFSRAQEAMPEWLWSGIVFYAAGQVIAWTAAFKVTRKIHAT